MDVYFVSHRNVVRKYVLCTCVVQVLAVLRPADVDVCKLCTIFEVRACFMHHIGAFGAKFLGHLWHVACLPQERCKISILLE